MLKLLHNLRRREWTMAAVCTVLILGQIYFDLSLPDYMSNLTVLIKTPGSTMSDILDTGLKMLGCTLASAALCVICGYLTAKVAAGFSFSIRENIFHKIADFGQQEMMSFSVPSLINRTYQNAKFLKGNETLMRTQLFNQRAFAFLMRPVVTLAMNALSLVIYWVGASIVNAIPAADAAERLSTFSNIVVFGTFRFTSGRKASLAVQPPA